MTRPVASGNTSRAPRSRSVAVSAVLESTSDEVSGPRVRAASNGRVTSATSVCPSSIEEGLEAGRALLADPSHRPTAILAQSDLLAAGVIWAAEELGIAVPAELSVVGFDGIRVDGLQHDLTTLVQPSVAKGRAAGEAIVRLLDGEPGQPAESVQFTSTLHVGSTTAPPRG